MPRGKACWRQTNSYNSVEFPAVGFRDRMDGSLSNAGQWGEYWSSDAGGSVSTSSMFFHSSNLGVTGNNGKQSGYSVRCVR